MNDERGVDRAHLDSVGGVGVPIGVACMGGVSGGEDGDPGGEGGRIS